MTLALNAHHPLVIERSADFDRSSGNLLERLIFNWRPLVLLLCLLATLWLGWQASRLQVNASFEKMVPTSHEFVRNAMKHKALLKGMGNTVRVVVENTTGDIFDPSYLEQLRRINDALYLTKGIDQNSMRGLWTSNLRWTQVTEEGYRGGPVMPDGWDGSSPMREQLRANIVRSGIIDEYVASDFRSSVISASLIETDPETGRPLDYHQLYATLDALRHDQTPGIKVHVVGFIALAGELMEGLLDVAAFFAVSVVVAAICLIWYMRCVRSTLLLVVAALLGVVWLLGLMRLLGYVLDPYTVLVPFLVFAIGLSHGAQKLNGVMQDIGRGTHKYVAARYTFRRLFLAGFTALLTNVVGFAVLMVIDIPIIRDIAVTTSIGVGILIVTKLVLIPVMLSYIGVSPKAALRAAAEEGDPLSAPATVSMAGRAFAGLAALTERRAALVVIAAYGAVTLVGFALRSDLRVGDLGAGAPELRPSSQYNQGVAYVAHNYGQATDVFIAMLTSPPDGCMALDAMSYADFLGQHMAQVEGVRGVVSAADGIRIVNSAAFEGNPKLITIPRNVSNLRNAYSLFAVARPDISDPQCAVLPIFVSLEDHRAETLTRVVDAARAFSALNDRPNLKLELAAGNAGVEAATNVVVQSSFWTMHAVLYGAVALLCMVTFRSWRATLVALIPLVITSVLCEALMAVLGIGLKVATLPVIAVGVGVGVDYALYLLSVQLAAQRRGVSLREAYALSIASTGRMVALVGFTMSIGVVTWAFSPIKFQADMGILLTFMFLWNMVGALTLIPALSHFLLRTMPARASARLAAA